MATIKNSDLKLVEKLYYKDGLTMDGIAKHLGVSIDSVVYYMRLHNVKRRTKKEDSVRRFENKPLSFSLAKKLTKRQTILKILGVSLYWGEGYKTEKSAGIDLANSDVDIILTFLAFLREVCGIDESRLRVLLYCHENQNQENLIKFWSRETKIPIKQFTKPYVRKNLKHDRIRTMPHGLVHIRYADKKLLMVIKNWIEECKAVKN
jgi:hypothetical protein